MSNDMAINKKADVRDVSDGRLALKELDPFKDFHGGLDLELRWVGPPGERKRLVRGKFSRCGKRYGLYERDRVKSNSYLDNPSFLVQRFNPRLTRMLDVFSDMGTEVEIQGRYTDASVPVLYVTDFVITSLDGQSGHYGSDDRNLTRKSMLTRRIITTLLQDPEERISQRAEKIQLHVSEYRLWFECCREIYPPAIRKWAEDSFQQLSDQIFDSTLKKHITNSLGHILSVDWDVKPLELPGVNEVKEILDRELFGLEDVKTRIMEIVARIRHGGGYPRYGILINGPAGVGKTSIMKAIVHIFNLPTIDLDFTSVTSRMDLVGSQRVFSNAIPGRFAEKVYEAGTGNLLITINELDKAGAHERDEGSPAEALLSLLDGFGFRDEYIQLRLPTAGMIVIATCNNAELISRPLLNRFYRIDVPGYTPAEKKQILTNYTLPRLREDMKIPRETVDFTDEALDMLVERYANLSDIRELERCAERLLCHFLLRKETDGIDRMVYSSREVEEVLGPSRVLEKRMAPTPGLVFSAGCCEGRPVVFPVEASVTPGTGNFEVLNAGPLVEGQCRAAYLCLRNEMDSMDFSTLDITVMLPRTIPFMEGNYVGVAAYAAMVSALFKDVGFIRNKAFLGGCDLFGNISMDTNDSDALLRMLSQSGLDTVYAPLGLSAQVRSGGTGSVTVVEGVDVHTLMMTAFDLRGSRTEW